MEDLRGLVPYYGTTNAEIAPWGCIEHLKDSSACIWSDKFLRYGTGDFRAHVTSARVDILDLGGHVVESIPAEECILLKERQSFVNDDGYVREVSFRSGDFRAQSLKQAARGEQPGSLDNSSFTKVDPSLSGEDVVLLFYVTYEGGETHHAMVFSKSGVHIPCEVLFPLSYERWKPESENARPRRGIAHN